MFICWQGKQKPFSSPAIGRVVSESSEVKIDRDKTEEADFSCGLDMAFEQLKHTGKESIDPVCFPAADGQVQTCSSTQDTQVSRKRGNSFEGLLSHLMVFQCKWLLCFNMFFLCMYHWLLMLESVHIYCSFVQLIVSSAGAWNKLLLEVIFVLGITSYGYTILIM